MSWQSFVDLLLTGALLIIALVVGAEIRNRRDRAIRIRVELDAGHGDGPFELTPEELLRAAEGAGPIELDDALMTIGQRRA